MTLHGAMPFFSLTGYSTGLSTSWDAHGPSSPKQWISTTWGMWRYIEVPVCSRL